MQRVAIVGAGFAGAVIARELAEAGIACVVMDERGHVAGNCHTERDPRTGIMVHCYGPHIFHTDKQHVWDYINRFGEMVPYILRVKTNFHGRVYSLPVNLHTINQFFDRAMKPAEARAFIEMQARKEIADPQSFEEQALRFLGAPLYEAFFKGYTRKHWGTEPSALPASILKRLPLRFDYNDNYFDHPYQAIPREGYTELVRSILSHRKIELCLNCRFEDVTHQFSHVFYSGGVDRYYRYSMGRLGYRTLDFERSYHDSDYQGTAVMNYPEESVPYTRVTEHKHLAPWEAADANGTIVFHEASRSCGPADIPYYPIRLVQEMALLKAYEERARLETNVSFVGRLGTYRYLDMDMTIDHALAEARDFLSWRSGKSSA